MKNSVKDLTDNEKRSYENQDFKYLELSGQNITTKEFDNCLFSNCDFNEVQFKNVKFYECKFERCNLSVANFMGCSFYDILFEASKMIGIDWTKAVWPKIKLASPVRFHQCLLTDSSFMGLCLREIEIIECKAHDVDFRETDCTEADFTLTDLTNSLFNNTQLANANFIDATNYNINIFYNNIKKAKFTLPEAMNLLASLEIELVD